MICNPEAALRNKTMEEKKYYTNLDLLKWICALCVVAIHTMPLQRLAPVADAFLSGVFLRVAVSLFFAVSGFGFFRKLIFENGTVKKCPKNRARLRRYLKKIGCLYLGWSAVYFLYRLPGWYEMGWWGMTLVKDSIAAFFFQGTYYHMWYLLALLYAVPALYLLLSVIPRKRMTFLMALFWLLDCAIGAYAWTGLGPLLAQIPYFSLLDGPVHALLRSVPLLYVGLYAADAAPHRTAFCKKLTALSAAMLFAEASALYFSGVNRDNLAFLLSTPALVYGILSWLLAVPQFSDRTAAALLRKSSVVIYCTHPLILQLCKTAFAAEPPAYWIVCTVISAAAGLVYAAVSNRAPQAK